jgi:hypothetical protein
MSEPNRRTTKRWKTPLCTKGKSYTLVRIRSSGDWVGEGATSSCDCSHHVDRTSSGGGESGRRYGTSRNFSLSSSSGVTIGSDGVGVMGLGECTDLAAMEEEDMDESDDKLGDGGEGECVRDGECCRVGEEMDEGEGEGEGEDEDALSANWDDCAKLSVRL